MVHDCGRKRREGKPRKDGKIMKKRKKESSGSDEDDLNEFSHSDEVDIGINGQSTSEEQVHLSSFNLHLEHTFSKEDIDNGKDCKFKWKIPVVGNSNCTWTGTGENILEDSEIYSFAGLTPKLYERLMDVYKTSTDKDRNSPQQKMFFSLCNSYRDIIYCNKRPKGLTCIMDAYILHSLNHVFRSRATVKKNDAKLTRFGKSVDTNRFRDQGFTNPKVLILLPYACNLYRVVKRLIQLTPSAYKVKVEHMDRFSTKFGSEEHECNEENAKPQKPSKFHLLSGGNDDDSFIIGIKFIRNKIRLFNNFHTSDIIVASALCLANKIEEAKHEKGKDVDFLSSIEVLIIDHADVITMQNWWHMNMVIDHLNCLPSELTQTNVMRIRTWYLEERARFYRQTIILGSHINPEIWGSFINQCCNYEGKVKLICMYKGVLHEVFPKLQERQLFKQFHVDSLEKADDARFDFFVKKIFPRIKDSDQGGIMIFISSYLDFTRIRKFLKSQNASYCPLSEYTTKRHISSSCFIKRRKKIVLYTERAHFYHRCNIREVRELFFYSLPETEEFYPEIVNMLNGSDNAKCSVMYSRLDMFKVILALFDVPFGYIMSISRFLTTTTDLIFLN